MAGWVVTRTAPCRISASRSRSRVRSNSDMDPGKLGRVVAHKVPPHEIRLAAGILRVRGGQHGAAETRCPSGVETWQGILDHDATLRHDIEHFARPVESLRVRLAG